MTTLLYGKHSSFSYECTSDDLAFNTPFSMGVLDVSHVTAYVVGELDGLGEQLYRAITYDITTNTTTFEDALPTPCTVVIQRTVPKDALYISFVYGADVTRGNMDILSTYTIMALHEVLDGRMAQAAWDNLNAILLKVTETKNSIDALYSIIVEREYIFPTRDIFVAWAVGKTPPVGLVINCGGYAYRWTASGTYINDLPGWVPDGPWKLQHFGATGDGTTSDAAAWVSAATAAVAAGVALIIPVGTYNLASVSTPSLTGSLTIIGEDKRKSILVGGAAKDMVSMVGGSSFSAKNIFFQTWLAVARLADNTATGIFGTIEVCDCKLDGIRQSAISDAPYYAPSGITVLRFTGNECTNIGQVSGVNSAALRVESASIQSAFVLDNEVRSVGGASYTGQKAAFSLGGVTVTALSSVVIDGNRIYDVQNDGTGGGGGGGVANVSGIIVFGRSTRVVNNAINMVKSANTNVDQYGIYTKSSYSTILGNTLVDAGGNASCIMTKGYPNDTNGRPLSADDFDNVIADNTILITSRWASAANKYTGITSYNAGMNIHDNIISGVTYGIYSIEQVVAGGDVGRNMIHHNKINNLTAAAGAATAGIKVDDANRSMIESNEIRNVGSGVEVAAYGIAVEAMGAYAMADVTIRGNIVEDLSASTTSQSRGIVLAQTNASSSLSNVSIDGNSVIMAGRGVQCSFVGTVNKMSVRGNSFDTMSVSNFGFSGTAPTDAVMSGNIIDGKDYLTVASGTTAIAVAGVDNLILNNAAATTVASFSSSFGNQIIRLDIQDVGNTTIANNASIKLAGGVNWTPAAGGMITLRKVGTVFKEVSRAVY